MPSLSVRTAILLVNLGSPDEPEPSALRRYLAEFLWDPRVVDLPRLPWWLILHGVILRTRPAKSAEKYARIWTDEGSPLKVHTEKQAKLLRGFLGARGRPEIDVSWAMRYGRPSIGGALDQLVAQGFERVLVLPLYPQYAHSTTASVMDAVAAWVAGSKSPMAVGVLPSFPEDEGYIGALAASVRKHWQTQGRAVDDDRFLLMSFHGIPRKVAQRGDPYPQECERTARRLAEVLGLRENQWRLTYQSRFGRAEWLQPYTQQTLETLGAGGKKIVDVICPGFVSDCLETLEEIAMENKAAFLKAGGQEFHFIPCLNENPDWIESLEKLVLKQLSTASPAPS